MSEGDIQITNLRAIGNRVYTNFRPRNARLGEQMKSDNFEESFTATLLNNQEDILYLEGW